MKRLKIFLGVAIVTLVSSAALAGDFDWIDELNVTAVADASGFRAQLVARFKINIADIEAVIRRVEKPADAYMILRLGEMSNQPTNYVIEQYTESGKGKGWGTLAKSLGIKPGSAEFHALKREHDLSGGGAASTERGKGKGKGRR